MNKEQILASITAELKLSKNILSRHIFNSRKNAVLCGDIYNDAHKRWRDGTDISTSNVKRVVLIDDTVYAITRSDSVYQLDIDETAAKDMCANCDEIDIYLEIL